MEVKASFEGRTVEECIDCCYIEEISITEPETEIARVIGEHYPFGQTDKDIISVLCYSKNVLYFPRNLQEIFSNLTVLRIISCGLKEISREDLAGLEKLEHLDLSENNLRSLPSDLFTGMKSLRSMSFESNKLEFLSSKILEPIAANGLGCVNFRRNLKIDVCYWKGGKQAPDCVSSLQKLMVIIDKKCSISPEEERLQKLWTSRRNSVFTIGTSGEESVEMKEFEVHKKFLAAHSPVFAAAYYSDTKKAQAGEMNINDFNAETFEELLYFLYTRNVKDKKNAMKMFTIANKYEVTGLKEITQKIILRNIDESNAIDIFDYGELHSSVELKRAALKKMLPNKEVNDALMENPERLKMVVEAARKIKEAQAELDAMF
jgi:Leucine-rich repeat (LRR) protein